LEVTGRVDWGRVLDCDVALAEARVLWVLASPPDGRAPCPAILVGLGMLFFGFVTLLGYEDRMGCVYNDVLLLNRLPHSFGESFCHGCGGWRLHPMVYLYSCCVVTVIQKMRKNLFPSTAPAGLGRVHHDHRGRLCRRQSRTPARLPALTDLHPHPSLPTLRLPSHPKY
jgi:hypothetical protein